MRYAMIAGLVSLAVSACTTGAVLHPGWHLGWTKADLTGDVLERDIRECDREADRLAQAEPGHRATASPSLRTPPGTAAPVRNVEHARAHETCMKGRGYSRQPVS